MTSKERFLRMFQHKEADRIPMIDSPWGSTIERWRREGLPEKTDPAAFFGHERRKLPGLHPRDGACEEVRRVLNDGESRNRNLSLGLDINQEHGIIM